MEVIFSLKVCQKHFITNLSTLAQSQHYKNNIDGSYFKVKESQLIRQIHVIFF